MNKARSALFNRVDFEEKLNSSDSQIPVFKQSITDAKEVLKDRHFAGASSTDIVGQLTWFMDQILEQAWDIHAHLIPEKINTSLVAVGGYGRGELHPYSDIDLMVLTEKDASGKINEFAEQFIRFLWDIGLEVGHSVRSIKECVKESKADITTLTNLMEARHLLGDASLLSTMDEGIRTKKTFTPEQFFAGKMEEQTERHASYNDTAYNLEPNLKEGPGGLRDLHNILWMYNRSFGCRTYEELLKLGFLQEKGLSNFIRNRNTLWKLRNGLHFLNGRREDRLLFDHQRELAAANGYEDDKNNLAVEKLMKRYYRTVKDISLQNELLIQRYKLEVLHPKKQNVKAESINSRFQIRNDMIEMSNPDVFINAPYALLEIFLLMQQNKINSIHPDTIRAIRYNLNLINEEYRKDIRCIALFIEIFRHRTGLTHNLRRMNDYGVLGAYIPAWDKIVGQMQHDLFHVYTVDAHTLMLIRNLRRLDTHPEEFPLGTEILSKLYKPERLFIAGIFHDIAKGRGGDHSELGKVDAKRFALRHKMSEYDANLVAWLVEQHLFMSHFAQRRDINDPDVINEFLDIVGDQEHLDNLYLLTICDVRATSPKVWNAWKGQLLETLYKNASRTLRQGETQNANTEAHVKQTKIDALEFLAHNPKTQEVTEEKAFQVWDTLADDYFTYHQPRHIAWHIEAISTTAAIDTPIVSTRYSDTYESLQLFVFAAETKFLLSEITGAFDKAEINILDGQFHRSIAGYGFYTFVCTPPEEEHAREEEYLNHISELIRSGIFHVRHTRHVMQQPADVKSSISSRALKHFPIKPHVEFSNINANHTLMEVTAQNQPGLLHKVALCLLENNIRLINAKVSTLGERVEDTFFITYRDGSPILDKSTLIRLQNVICQALET